MQINFSKVFSPVTNTVTWAVSQAKTGASRFVQLGSSTYATVSPKVAAVVSKIQALNFKSVVAAVTTFAKSDLGVGLGLIAVAAGSIAACDKPYQFTAKTTALVALAFLAVTASATVVLKPAGFSFSVFRG